MTKKTKILTILIFSLTLGNYMASAQTAEEILPWAIRLEEVEGDLEQAIVLYQTIVSDYPESRSAVATAYFHMGVCYEKLGSKQAKNAYNTVVRDYGEQEDLVKLAKARLATLDQPSVSIQRDALTVKKIWEGEEVDYMGEPSPDGRFLSFVDWETGNLSLYEISTGKKRPLTSEGTWEDPIQFAESSCWSPDGKQLVYDWYNDENPSWIDFYIIGIEEKEPRKFWSNSEMEWAQCYDWSPDGELILACLKNKNNNYNHIALVSVNDGSERVLVDNEGQGWSGWPLDMQFSPDGKYVAFDMNQEKGSSKRDIYMTSTDGSTQIPLVTHPANDYLMGWTPDDQNIIFASDRNGAISFWLLEVDEGSPIGEPILIKSDLGPVLSLGFTDNNSFYYSNSQRVFNINIVELDPGSGKLLTLQDKAIQYFEGSNQTPAYSPDGKYLAYVRRFPAIPIFGMTQGGNVLCLRSLETGEEKEMRPNLNRFGYPAWSPDGNSVLVVDWDADDQMGYYQINVVTGEVTPAVLPRENFSLFGGHKWTPEGNAFYYGQRDKQTNLWNIVLHELDSGVERIIYQSEDFYNLALSPDGQLLVLNIQSRTKPRVIIISTSGEEIRELCSFGKSTRTASNNSIIWTADGNYILFALNNPEEDDNLFELCRIPANGGELTRLGLKVENGFNNLSTHPDGRHLTYSSASQNIKEIWVMENFLK
jgi:Tol biopolymer transport system component